MLLPILVGSAFFSSEGYRGGYFLANVDQDVAQVSREKFSWPVGGCAILDEDYAEQQ